MCNLGLALIHCTIFIRNIQASQELLGELTVMWVFLDRSKRSKILSKLFTAPKMAIMRVLLASIEEKLPVTGLPIDLSKIEACFQPSVCSVRIACRCSGSERLTKCW